MRRGFADLGLLLVGLLWGSGQAVQHHKERMGVER